MQEGPG